MSKWFSIWYLNSVLECISTHTLYIKDRLSKILAIDKGKLNKIGIPVITFSRTNLK